MSKYEKRDPKVPVYGVTMLRSEAVGHAKLGAVTVVIRTVDGDEGDFAISFDTLGQFHRHASFCRRVRW